MTKEELASLLNGRESGEEITPKEEWDAKASGLVALFGASDDLAEFRGAINDEAGCYCGGPILLMGGELTSPYHECDCDHCGYKENVKCAKKIEAVWCGEEGYSWTYYTDIPHATFDIMEDGNKYCRGIVFDIKEVA